MTNRLRVLHGGPWYPPPRFCRAAERQSSVPGYRSRAKGFRTVRMLGTLQGKDHGNS